VPPLRDDRLVGTRFAELRTVARTGSTNADLLAAAAGGSGECALVADVQDAGRGRLDRRWEAPAGASLLMSVLVRPPFPVGGPQLLAVALGLAATDAIAEVAGVDVGLKWPNDLVTLDRLDPRTGAPPADRKLGGMLAELATDDQGLPTAAVLGIGVNVAWPAGFPDELADTAAALDQLAAPVERTDLAVSILRHLDARGRLLDHAAVEAMVGEYRRRCVTVGRSVRVELPAGEVTGVAHDIAADGSLLVRDSSGGTHTVRTGDVVHLRSAD
jgi:BirA family transcriptional regulator, biotin operon repressor / biotin---[acetyl-CoA-carboxylase] ligase